MKKISLPVSFDDERGKITDLLENEAINAVTVITFQKGAVRANHYHKNTFQWNYVMSGRVKLVTRMPGEDKTETVLGKGDFALTVPEEHHALVGLEYSELLVLTKGPRGGKEYESDTFRIEEPLA
ncbi:MAG: cupin domain-containing protein [Nitrospirae bacterium]|nr:cupin domain-containing protein [Nitrospirota bacterium]